MKSTLKFLTLSGLMVLGSAAACSSKSNEPTPGSSGTNGTNTGNANNGANGTNASGSTTTSGLACATSTERDCGGVCVNIATDTNNCGGCGNICGTGQDCQVATCVCQGSLQNCGGACINTNADAANCGTCGMACATGQVCDRGTCTAECSAGLTNCNQGCTNPLSDPFNCGGCGNTCGAGQNCVSGACQGAATTTTSTTVTSSTVTGTTTTTTTGGGGATSTDTTASSTTSVGGPAGWWTYEPLNWAGCAWTGIDTVQGSTTTVVPQDFTTGHAAGDPYCVSGTVHDDYESVALLGFNLAEDPATADCSYDPADATGEGPPGVTLGGTGIAVNFEKSVASTLRVQIQGPNGATDENDRWCATITEVSGKVFVPWSEFVTQCWEGAENPVPYANEPISAVVFLVPGQAEGNFTDYGFCINGFATGSSADDAPDGGGGGGPLTGEIGGPGSTDNDFQRVKVKGKDGKEYVIQNNNWGNPDAYNQTLSYSDNSFKIIGETGAGGNGEGVPASFPSIFIGHNGDRQGGAFSTNDSNLPKVINTITSIPTTFKVAKPGGFNGDYNVSYDVWFSANNPGEAEYTDGISGFVMIWMYKPSGHDPIGWPQGVQGSLSIGGHSFNVYKGPREQDKPNERPVVNYVNTGAAITELDFDLKAVIDDAVQNHGISSSWYLTDVFGGFEIWNGAGTNGLECTEFTAVVN